MGAPLGICFIVAICVCVFCVWRIQGCSTGSVTDLRSTNTGWTSGTCRSEVCGHLHRHWSPQTSDPKPRCTHRPQTPRLAVPTDLRPQASLYPQTSDPTPRCTHRPQTPRLAVPTNLRPQASLYPQTSGVQVPLVQPSRGRLYVCGHQHREA